jgi:hypothetical protein
VIIITCWTRQTRPKSDLSDVVRELPSLSEMRAVNNQPKGVFSDVADMLSWSIEILVVTPKRFFGLDNESWLMNKF